MPRDLPAYRLVRSRRRTLALVIDRDGALIARAPMRMPVSAVERFIADKAAWIARARASLPPALPPLTLTEGASLPLNGRALTLRPAPVRAPIVQPPCLLFPAEWAGGEITPLVGWVRAEAGRALAPLVARWAERMRLYPKRVAITAAKTRWGSMSSAGVLRLNLSLLLCPPEIVDYVVVQELSHIAHPAHSPAFWARVESPMPDTRARRDWLRAHASLIRFLPR